MLLGERPKRTEGQDNMKSIAKCNKCGFVYKYNKKPAKIRCRACGSNESLSIRQGVDVFGLIRRLEGCIAFSKAWPKIA